MNHTSQVVPSLLLYCRAGFEKECAAEILEHAGVLGITGYIRAKPGSGFINFVLNDIETSEPLRRSLNFKSLVFARQLIFAVGPVADLPTTDRITPLLGYAKNQSTQFSGCFLETADTNEAKELSSFLNKFGTPFRRALEQAGLMGNDPELPRLHLFFLSSTSAYIGISLLGNSSPWPMGIPRLRFPGGAPSRSTLKLEEAFLVFVEDPERLLRPGMTAVDLGAAPGGWTWQLVRRHFRIIAVDNGSLDPALLESGVVEHFRTDGFRYRPPKPVDWLVCDMVEQPRRCASLVADWVADRWTQRAIFNLKLPMKKRYEEIKHCRALMEARLAKAGIQYRLAFKQLYHDRAEITGYICLD